MCWKNEERRHRRVVFNFLTIYFKLKKCQKYADPVGETVLNIFGWHYLNVFCSFSNMICIFFAYNILEIDMLNKTE